mgnify:CR=1 FL=1
MSLRQDPLDELTIPSGTVVEEHDLVTESDVLVGGQSTVEFGVRGRSVAAGERSSFGGHIEAENDCRLDMWTDVEGDVLVGEDAYLGERVNIDGRLVVNPGSVGQPRDRDGRAAYAVLDTDTDNVVLRRVEYDVDQVITRVEERGLPTTTGTRLLDGS